MPAGLVLAASALCKKADSDRATGDALRLACGLGTVPAVRPRRAGDVGDAVTGRSS